MDPQPVELQPVEPKPVELQPVDPQKVLSDIEGALAISHVMAVRLQTGITILGIVAVACSLAVTAFANELGYFAVKVLSFISLLIFTLLTAYNVSGKHNDIRKAWRYLNIAYLRYQAGNLTLIELVEAKKSAEEMLGYIEFDSAALKSKPTEP